MEHPTSASVEAVERALVANGVEPRTRWFDDSTSTAQQAADALGIEVGAIANSLIFALDGGVILILASGGHRVDTNWLGAQLGGVLERARPADVKAATGQIIGGVAPVGHPRPIRTLVDEALADYPELWASAGHPHAVFATTFDELVRITGGTPSRVTP